MKKLLIILAILILLVIGALTYIGFFPGLVKSVDLGSKNDPALVSVFEAAHGMKNEVPGGIVPAGRQAEFSGQVSLDADLSSNEVTSVLAYWKKRSPNLPIRDVQVRFNSDGTGEASGILEIKTAINIAKFLGYNDEQIATGEKYIKYVAGDVPFYVKGIGGVTNNQVTIYPTDFKLGRVQVPKDITTQVAGIVGDAIEKRLGQVSGVDVKSLDFSKGSLHISGTVPETVK